MLKHHAISAALCEPFQKRMKEQGWTITHQDVGQTELVGYGYVIVWEKEGEKVILHYADRQGVAEANLEVSAGADADIQSLLKTLGV